MQQKNFCTHCTDFFDVIFFLLVSIFEKIKNVTMSQQKISRSEAYELLADAHDVAAWSEKNLIARNILIALSYDALRLAADARINE